MCACKAHMHAWCIVPSGTRPLHCTQACGLRVELPDPLVEVGVPCCQALPPAANQLASGGGGLPGERRRPRPHCRHHTGNDIIPLWYVGKNSMVEAHFIIEFFPKHQSVARMLLVW